MLAYGGGNTGSQCEKTRGVSWAFLQKKLCVYACRANIDSSSDIRRYIYYACGYRMASGAVVYKQFILYKSDEEDHITKFTKFELKYNYDMLRDFVQYTLNVDLEKPYIQTLLTKYKAIEGKDKESQNSFFTIPTSTISNKYSTIFRRLGN